MTPFGNDIWWRQVGWVRYWDTRGQMSHRRDNGLNLDIHVRTHDLFHMSILGGYVPVQQGYGLGQPGLCLSGCATCDMVRSDAESE